MANYFEVFGLPRKLQIDLDALQREFYELSRRYHPDFHHGAGAEDQARALATVASLLTSLPLRPAIHRLRSGPAQATLGELERRANVKGAFAGIAGSLRGLHVGLVDDVATTGATLLDAAAAARACGARDVRAYVVAFEE